MTAAPGRIRIIGGHLRNSRLNVPDLPGLRPTAERVRETLFNWLAPTIEGVRALDLCAGTGALGIEALSRGAAEVRFVERVGATVEILRTNLSRLKAIGGLVTTSEAAQFLQGTAQPFGLVFIDPPFAQRLWTPLAQRLEEGGWLTPSALVYVESPREMEPALPAQWQLHRVGQTLEVRYALYRRISSVPLS
jgi:16S rRNA (guanine966-N2)-methyltransferase